MKKGNVANGLTQKKIQSMYQLVLESWQIGLDWEGQFCERREWINRDLSMRGCQTFGVLDKAVTG